MLEEPYRFDVPVVCQDARVFHYLHCFVAAVQRRLVAELTMHFAIEAALEA